MGDPNGWGRIGAYTPTYLDTLTNAVISGHQIELQYQSPRTGTSRRTISPLGLVTKRNVWYLVANTEKGLRTFRVSRVVDAQPLSSPAVRPDDFDLETEWERIMADVETRRTTIEVEVIAEQQVVKALRYQFAGRVALGETLADGRQALTLTDNGVRPMAAQLACHGNAVEVIDPSDALQAEFRRIAGELAEMWLDRQ